MAHVHDVRPRRSRTALATMIAFAIVVAGLVPALVARSSAEEPVRSLNASHKFVVKPNQAAPASTQRPAALEDRPGRGLVYQGLGHSKVCPGGYLLEGTSDVCTHGPDPVGGEHGPAGVPEASAHDHSASQQKDTATPVDVRDVPTTSQLIDAAGELLPSGTSSTSGQIPCYGDGVSGPRIQMVYAVASDRTNRYQALVDTFPVYAARANAVFQQTAQAGGDTRNLRFVHTADCRLDVLQVVLSPTGDDTFANMVTELRNIGLTRTDRKYMVWADAGVYCGVATVAQDETPGSTNRANLGPTFARVDAACWGSTNSVEAHEISHNLGAVQLGAPNSNGAWHCTDEYDRLCYNDGSGATMRYVCPTGIEALLDCNGDDYFSLNPAPGSYLASHWNLADSVFLSSQAPGSADPVLTPSPSPTDTSPAPQPSTSPTASPSPTGPVSVTSTFSGSLNRKQSVREFSIAAASGPVAASLSFTKAKSMRLTLVAPDASAVVSGSGATPVQLVTSDVPAGRYLVRVDGATSGSFTVTVTYNG